MTETVTRFKARRVELGLTQQDIADRCLGLGVQVTDSHISKIERNLTTPQPRLRRALREVLGADPVLLQKQQAEVAA